MQTAGMPRDELRVGLRAVIRLAMETAEILRETGIVV